MSDAEGMVVALAGNVFDDAQVLVGDGLNGFEELSAFFACEAGCGGALQQITQFGLVRLKEQVIELRQVALLDAIELAQDRADVCPGKARPNVIFAVVVGNYGAGELFGVLRDGDLGEQVPACRAVIEGVQDDVAAARVIEALQVVAIQVGDDRPVAASKGSRQELADGGAFACRWCR